MYKHECKLKNPDPSQHVILRSLPTFNFQLLTFNYPGGAYCKKRLFQAQKTSETKQMLIRFFDLKKGLFPLF
ncbi:hypothetical protein DWW90_13890 [Parabacteroides sp. AF17-28]|nr:hypothetical protein DWW90_13890 [Parabacteroides sp. AF17-28]